MQSGPIPTYVLGPNNFSSTKFYPELNGCDLAPNITYLGTNALLLIFIRNDWLTYSKECSVPITGKRGVYTTNTGLIIAYVSGVEDPKLSKECQITADDIERVRIACVKNQQESFRGIDVLLTSEWPAGVTNEDNNPV